jgi:hypothetical protein
MAKSSITVPSQAYTPGTRTVNLPNLTTDDNGIRINMTRESWPDTGSNIITGTIEASDDGVTWRNMTVFGYPGGNQINPRTGQPVLVSSVAVYWPERTVGGVAVPQRPAQVRATVTNTVTLTTALSLIGV